MEYWERRQQLADRCACEGALCTARRSPAIPYRRTAFFGQKLPIPSSNLDDGRSHNFATAFLRNLRCSAVMGSNVWACQNVKNRLNYNTPWLPSATHRPHG